jgi:putative nucleotidyltransferase with HDIG domain
MRHIKSTMEIDYDKQESISFEATILDVTHDGDAEKRYPMKFTVKLEGTGEVLAVVSWTYELLDYIKEGIPNTNVYMIEGIAGIFKDQSQIRIGSVKNIGKKSTKKVIETIDIDDVKQDIYAILNKYVRTDSIRKMIDELVFNNEKFYKWPAATKLHHNYEGGLAKHTLQVTKHAINFWQEYEGKGLDIEVIVASALLHDIGKTTEYNQDGSRTVFGDLISHLVNGAEKVAEWCWKNNIDSNRDTKMIMIKHCILSHHEKQELGAAVLPSTLEAMIVARADAFDALFEGSQKEVNNVTTGSFTNKLMIANNNKILKWL